MRLLLFAILTGSFIGSTAVMQDTPVGYDDTPQLPGQKWKVHDKNRPEPRVVTPGSSTNTAPSDAIVLFDGTDLSRWEAGNGSEAKWKVQDGYMEVNGSGKIRSKEQFGDCQIHIEWASPAEVAGNSQGRGNSGVFLMDRYEIQVLDSYENRSYADGQAAAMYGQYPPRVNACRGPGEWQTYDIIFTAPRFEDGKVVEPATLTLFHNGVAIHNRQPYLGSTTHKQVARYSPHGATGPLALQDHGNPVRFRNIWVRPLGEYDKP